MGTRIKPVRQRKVVRTILAVLVGLPVAAITGLFLWDGGIDNDPRREIIDGARIDLRTVTTRLGPVEYDLHGKEGPVLLSVHAGLGGADQGRLFADWLRNDGFRILSPSRPGYLGTPLDSGRTNDEQADLLAALLDELGIDRVGVLGVSAGSPVAYTFAARHPDRVWGLVSIGGLSKARPGGESSPLRRTFMNVVGQKLALLTAALSFESIIAGTLDETSTFTEEQRAGRVAYITGTPSARALFKAMFEMTFPYERRWPGTDNDAAQAARRGDLPLARITAPTLVIHGTQDGDVPFDHGEFAARRIPGAQRHWLQHEDHLGFWLSPEAPRAQAVARAFLHDHARSTG